jgi:DnaJ domain
MDRERALGALGIHDGIDDLNDLNPAQLRKAYLKAALACHPDKNKGDQDAAKRFTELQEAYNFLFESISTGQDAAREKARTLEIFDLFLRAMHGDNVEVELKNLGVYRPSDMFGIDLSVAFDRRLPPPPSSSPSNCNVEEEPPVDIQDAFVEAFADEGLDEEGNPLEGWARPPIADLEDL